MITYQDYQNAGNKQEFLLDCIRKFKDSATYKVGKDAQKYYEGENSTVMSRLQWFYDSSGSRQDDMFRANNKIGCEFYTKITKQANSYLFANGVTVDEEIKKGLGKNFDTKLLKLGTYSLVDGVSYAYCYLDTKGFDIAVWRGTEVIPLFDEASGILRMAIRFWQLEDSKPLYIELFEENGKTTFIQRPKEATLDIYEPKKSYRIKVAKDILGETVIEDNNFTVLPIVPLYCNDINKSSFTKALKSKIDLYDIILSDFGNNLEDNNDMYWVLRNYAGQDIGEFLYDFKKYKTIKVDDDGEAHTEQNEVPYQARQTALEIIRKEIYSSAMALDTTVLSGGSLTNVAIKTAMSDLDLKTDTFEMNAIETVSNIIDIMLETTGRSGSEYTVNFIRRTLVNDTEIVDNIQKFRMDITHLTALTLNPYIENAQEELENFDEESIEKFDKGLDEMEQTLTVQNDNTPKDEKPNNDKSKDKAK